MRNYVYSGALVYDQKRGEGKGIVQDFMTFPIRVEHTMTPKNDIKAKFKTKAV